MNPTRIQSYGKDRLASNDAIASRAAELEDIALGELERNSRGCVDFDNTEIECLLDCRGAVRKQILVDPHDAAAARRS